MAATSKKIADKKIAELTSREAASRVTAQSVLCLPIGSIEQHGPHLPLDTDAVIAERVAERIAAQWGDAYDLWILPTLSISLAREHEWAAGTLSCSLETFAAVIRDHARSLVRNLPTRNLLIVNGHGGNNGVLSALAQDLRADFGLNVCVFHPTGCIPASGGKAVPDYHGGAIETSMMLALAPDRVRVDRMPAAGDVPKPDPFQKAITQKGVTWPWTSDDPRLAVDGVIGDVTGASAEEGERILREIVEVAGGVLKQLRFNQTIKR